MADISGYIRIINEAEKGEAVRDAITGALEEMNTYGGNASTLENHPASYFATATFFTAVAEQVGEVDDVLIAIENGLNALKYDMGEYTLSGSGGSFTVDCTGIKGYDNLDISKFYFEILGGSNASQAGNWTPSQSYNPETGVFTYSWGALSNNIRVKLWIVKPTSTSVGIQVQPLVITENGNWDAGANAAYNPVTIRVPNVIDVRKLTQSITKNGIYTFTPEPNTGFNEVQIHVEVPIPPEKVLVTQTFTENGTYRAIDEDPAADGFSIVTVNVDSKILIEEKTLTANGDWSASDEGADGVMNVHVDVPTVDADLGHKTIGQNGTYNAEDDDLDGYDSVTVAVPTKELIEKVITANGIYLPSEEVPPVDGYSMLRVLVSGGGSYPVKSVDSLFGYNRYDYNYFPVVLSMFETDEITNWGYLFRSSNVNDGDVDLTGLDASAATKMQNMFYSFACDNLIFDEHIFDGPMNGDTRPVYQMFNSANIGKIIFDGVEFIANCSGMFLNAIIGELSLNSADLSNVISAVNMFGGCGGDFVATVDKCIGQIFADEVDAQYLFTNSRFSKISGQLTGGKRFGKIKNALQMFQSFKGDVEQVDPSIFDYSLCTSVNGMFSNISAATGKNLTFNNLAAPLCTDIAGMYSSASILRKLEANDYTFAIATSAANFLNGNTNLRVIKMTNLSIANVTNLSNFIGSSEYHLRFLDLYGLVVGSAKITNCENFIAGNTASYIAKNILLSFTALPGTNTVEISISNDQKDRMMYEGVDDGYNYMHYTSGNANVTLESVSVNYSTNKLVVEYTNSTASNISTTIVCDARVHVYLPKTFDCTAITNANYRPLVKTPVHCIDIYTDGTYAEIAALNWCADPVDNNYFRFHFETTHETFLALPEATYE